MPRRTSYDRLLFLSTGLLVVFGLFMVGSASSYAGLRWGMGSGALWSRHIAHLAAGIVLFAVALRIPYRRLEHPGLVGGATAASLAILVLVLGAPAVQGAHRWFPLGPFRFQPSEVAKLATILFLAFVLSRRERRVNDPWVLIPCLSVVVVTGTLIVVEPDLGSAVMLCTVAVAMLFAAGLRFSYLAALGAAGAVAFAVGVLAEPYRMRRLRAFLDPAADSLDGGWQLTQSKLAFGAGGLFGRGLGTSTQKAHYLYGAHTDFIYSVVGEELGMVGAVSLLALFLIVFWRGMRTAMAARDRFGFYLALGLTYLLVIQALINMCVCLGLLPTKGMALPFISYGGSSLLASMLAMGLLINVSQQSN